MISFKYFNILAIMFFLLAYLFFIPVMADEPIKDRRSLIGELVPITGDTAHTNLYVTFATGSAQLTKTAKTQLDELGAALLDPELENMNIAIYGHTDASGTQDSNLLLSKRRAQSVFSYLKENFELNNRSIIHDGFGETSPLNPIDTFAAENRRVEIVTSRKLTPSTNEAVIGETQVIN